MTQQPHDALFKASVTPDAALALAQAVFPAELAQAFEGATLELAPSEFQEGALRDRSSDVLYRASLADEKEALIYVMVEHQSTVDPLMAFRVLRYMVRIWSQWLEHSEGRPKALPPILPIVLYHGRDPWDAPRSFHDLVDLPAALASAAHLVPSFEFQIDDLRRVSVESLLAREAPPFAAVAWVLLRQNYDDERGVEVLRLCAEQVRALVDPSREHLESLQQLATYMLLQDFGTSEELEAELNRIGGPRAAEVAVSTGEQLLERGREQGREQGRKEGRLEGERHFLLRGLRRLGTVSAEVEARVQGATEAELDTWCERVFSAKTVEEVFEG